MAFIFSLEKINKNLGRHSNHIYGIVWGITKHYDSYSSNTVISWRMALLLIRVWKYSLTFSIISVCGLKLCFAMWQWLLWEHFMLPFYINGEIGYQPTSVGWNTKSSASYLCLSWSFIIWRPWLFFPFWAVVFDLMFFESYMILLLILESISVRGGNYLCSIILAFSTLILWFP